MEFAVCQFCLAYGYPSVERVESAVTDPSANADNTVYYVTSDGRVKRQDHNQSVIVEADITIIIKERIVIKNGTVPSLDEDDRDSDEDY